MHRQSLSVPELAGPPFHPVWCARRLRSLRPNRPIGTGLLQSGPDRGRVPARGGRALHPTTGQPGNRACSLQSVARLRLVFAVLWTWCPVRHHTFGKVPKKRFGLSGYFCWFRIIRSTISIKACSLSSVAFCFSRSSAETASICAVVFVCASVIFICASVIFVCASLRT